MPVSCQSPAAQSPSSSARRAATPMPGALTNTRAVRDSTGSVLLRSSNGTTFTWTPSDRTHSDNQTQFGDVITMGGI